MSYETKFNKVNFLSLPVEDETSTLLLLVKVLFFVSVSSLFCLPTMKLLDFG